jgi:hypothetical protein
MPAGCGGNARTCAARAQLTDTFHFGVAARGPRSQNVAIRAVFGERVCGVLSIVWLVCRFALVLLLCVLLHNRCVF